MLKRSRERHLLLLIEFRNGRPIKEPVHAEEIGKGVYRLLYSPGLVQGIAAGDEFRLLDRHGSFEVQRRSGNLAVQLFALEPISKEVGDELVERVRGIGGVLDGAILKGMTFTVPVSAGFPAIEELFIRWTGEHPGWEWYFGNVYDDDGVTPLRWWE